jgi:hypothetical protein
MIESICCRLSKLIDTPNCAFYARNCLDNSISTLCFLLCIRTTTYFIKNYLFLRGRPGYKAELKRKMHPILLQALINLAQKWSPLNK